MMAGNLRRLGPLQLAGAAGNATGFIGELQSGAGVNGRVVAIQYIADGTNPYSDAFALTITGENSTITILAIASVASGSTSFVKYPLAAAAKAADGTASTLSEVPVPLFNERVIIVVGSSGGTTKTGQWFAIVE